MQKKHPKAIKTKYRLNPFLTLKDRNRDIKNKIVKKIIVKILR